MGRNVKNVSKSSVRRPNLLMILVLLGTQNNSFNRLLEEIEKNIANGNIKEKVIVQSGFTKFKSNKMEIFDFVSGEELEKLIEKASYIITHGGVGSILSSLKKGKKVIAVPRMEMYEEHVNNHQIEIVQKFNEEQYIIGVTGVEELTKAIKQIDNFNPRQYKSNPSKLINIVEDFIDNI
jgi:UDP-N-acetylglucosamine transferase subunit ALG13